MKKIIAFILLFYAYSIAISPFTYKWTIRLTGDTATVVKWKANNDSVLNWATRISDTVTHMPHWIELLRGDSTFHRIKADTISSNPIVDSIQGMNIIKGNPLIDSIQGMDNISGNPVIDSMQKVDKVSGNPIIDSISGMDCIRGNPDIDSISGTPIFTDDINLDADINQTGTKTELDINPHIMLRFGRTTNDTAFALYVYRGDNTSTHNHYFNGIGNSFICGNNGNLSIGKTTNNYKLDVSGRINCDTLSVEGSVKVGNSGDIASDGTIRWNILTNKLQVYSTSDAGWVNLH